ncbi:M15 family metallopeptidase [Oerskovia sp. Root22]|uniref:M15 family metallopeptidase n=1 Tax=Oerskovia sp. Root22 TaxID=1736494 RepID=UPI000AEFB05F|nr:M15 family metallopeptidase [Oerskovia sp. Root22]
MTFDVPPPPSFPAGSRPVPPAAAAPTSAVPSGPSPTAPTDPVPAFDTLVPDPPAASSRPSARGGRARPGRTWPSGRSSAGSARRRRTPADRVYAAVVVAALVACGVSAYRLLAPDALSSGVGPGAGAAPGTTGEADGSRAEAPATGLDPELLRRFEQAQALAAEDGIELTLVSGWRSAEEQAQVVEDVVRKRGSLEEAKRWVLPPEASAHVAGTAIDVGATDGALWLGEHGADLGLCRTYANEMWHFEAVIEPGGTCPEMHEDSRVGWE